MLRAQLRVSGAGALRAKKRVPLPFEDSPPEKNKENLIDTGVNVAAVPPAKVARNSGRVSFSCDVA